MSTIADFARRWNDMLESGEVWEESVANTEPQLLDVNRQQLMAGMGSDGTPLPDIRPFKSKEYGDYRRYKIQKNPGAGGRYDMNLTGHSFETMKLTMQRNQFTITSAGHAQEWDEKIGGGIFGIYPNPPLMDYRIKFLYPEIVRNIRLITGAK